MGAIEDAVTAMMATIGVRASGFAAAIREDEATIAAVGIGVVAERSAAADPALEDDPITANRPEEVATGGASQVGATIVGAVAV
jgi:hypothetical protein